MKARDFKSWFLFLSLLVLSLGLRIFRLNQGLWFDEIFSLIHYVRGDWFKILTDLSNPNNHILTNLLAKICFNIFGEYEWSVRLPSLIFGALTPPVFYLVYKNRLGQSISFWASMFLTLSYWMVWFSQDMRGYAGYIFCAILSQFFYEKMTFEADSKTVLGYVLASVIGCYFHFYMLFVLAVQILAGLFFWLQERKKKIRSFLFPILSLLLIFLLYLPGLGGLIGFAEGMGHDVGDRWMNRYFLIDLLNLFSGSRFLIVQILFSLLFIASLIWLFRYERLLSWLYCSAFLLMLFLTWIRHYLIYARYEAFFIPFFFLGISVSIHYFSHFLSRKIRLPHLGLWFNFALAGIICFILVPDLFRYYDLGKQGFKKVTNYLERNYPSSPVVSLGVIGRTFLYYYPSAELVSGKEEFEEKVIRGKLLVASYPNSWKTWHPRNRQAIKKLCEVEKVWPSAGDPEQIVYLFNCLGARKGR